MKYKYTRKQLSQAYGGYDHDEDFIEDLLAQKEDRKCKNNCTGNDMCADCYEDRKVEDFVPSPIEQPDNIIIRSTDSIGYEVDRGFWDWIDDITTTVNFLRQSKK